MKTNIVVPRLGESISEGTISKWYKKPGDLVKEDEMVAEIETDKVALEINAPISGVIEKILKNENDTVAIGEVIGIIESSSKLESSLDNIKAEGPKSGLTNTINQDANSRDIKDKLSPAVRKFVIENDLDVNKIQGTGKNNRITKEDVVNIISNVNSPANIQQNEQFQEEVEVLTNSSKIVTTISQVSGIKQRDTKRVKMSRLRKTIAKRMKDSQNTAAILSTFNEIDMYNIVEFRKKYREEFEKKHGVKLGFMSFFVRAVVSALTELPIVNTQIDGDDIIYHNYCDIGIAVSTESGLVVPILRDADQLSFADIEKNIVELGKKAKNGKLSIDELTGGTFSITNGGIFGSLLSTPIINPPQSGILGMHNIQERAIVINHAIQIRPMMYVALSYDHRIIDGKEAVTFLVKIKNSIENPERLLLNI